MDPDYDEFDQSLVPKTIEESASAWTNAINTELVTLLSPMKTAQLVGDGIGSFNISPSSITPNILFPNDTVFQNTLDEAIDTAAANVTDVSGACVAPPASLDSLNTIFDPNPLNGLAPQFTITEICQRAEDRIIAWLMTGTFTAHFYPPGTGAPLTPWILPPGETIDVPDSDGDGFDDSEEKDAGTDIDDKKDYPEN